ncbi:MAG: hypothetical protein KGO96_13860 [Elusimicrobia bacterium]|nr:hypothetical protein [Elusimicrobiota bacterium]MDE2426979.1 hypothetical protein [Elusimicrobiota bacterium]
MAIVPHPMAASLANRYRVTPQRLRGTGGPTTMLGLPNLSGMGGSGSGSAPAATGNAPIIGGTVTLGSGSVGLSTGGSLVGMVGMAVIVLSVLAYIGTKEHQH